MAIRRPSAPAVQVFPFLAVLLCAMGALILLLLVTTRKLRTRAIQAAQAQQLPAEAEPEPEFPPEPEPAIPSAAPQPDLAAIQARAAERAAREAERAERIAAHESERQAMLDRQAEREADWKQALAELRMQKKNRQAELSNSRTELEKLQSTLQETETELARLSDQQSELDDSQQQDTAEYKALMAQQERLRDDILKKQKELALLKKALAASESRYAIVPYDGQSGTSRRPIFVECTAEGIRFWPENVLLDEFDLQGFSETQNPLLAGAQALTIYWLKKAVHGGQLDSEQKPYVLLLVRPSGTVSYYIARKMLTRFNQPFGYELLDDDFECQYPPLDKEAQRVLQQAIADALRLRDLASRQGVRVHDTEIDIETLDEAKLVAKNREQSPFQPGSGGSQKEFSFSRSPLSRQDVLPAMREPGDDEPVPLRTPYQVPGTLPDARGQGTGPGYDSAHGHSRVPGSLAERFQTGAGEPLGAGGGGGDIQVIPGNGSGSKSRDPLAPLTSSGSGAAGGSGSSREMASRENIPRGARGAQIMELSPFPDLPQAGNSDESSEPALLPPEVTQPQLPETTGRTGGQPGGTSPRNREAGSPEPNRSPGSPTAPRNSQPPPRRTSPRQAGQFPGRATDSQAETTSPRNAAASQFPGSLGGTRSPANSRQGQQSGSGGVVGAGPEVKSRNTPPAEARRDAPVAAARKREMGRQRWGGNPNAQIGFERQVTIVVQPDKLIVGKQKTEIAVSAKTNPRALEDDILTALDLEAAQWGRPPLRFYWVPYLDFQIHPGGEAYYHQVQAPLREWGIFSEAEFLTTQPGKAEVKK